MSRVSDSTGLEKAMAPHSSTLAWKISWTEKPGRLQSVGWLRVGHDWATSLSLSTFMHWRRKWQPTPVFLPGESQGRWSLMGWPSMGSHRVGHDWSDLAAAAGWAWELAFLMHPRQCCCCWSQAHTWSTHALGLRWAQNIAKGPQNIYLLQLETLCFPITKLEIVDLAGKNVTCNCLHDWLHGWLSFIFQQRPCLSI